MRTKPMILVALLLAAFLVNLDTMTWFRTGGWHQGDGRDGHGQDAEHPGAGGHARHATSHANLLRWGARHVQIRERRL